MKIGEHEYKNSHPEICQTTSAFYHEGDSKRPYRITTSYYTELNDVPVTVIRQNTERGTGGNLISRTDYQAGQFYRIYIPGYVFAIESSGHSVGAKYETIEVGYDDAVEPRSIYDDQPGGPIPSDE